MANIKVFFDTLGCAKNQVDTSKMEGLLSSNGFIIVETAQDADVIILNTCAFIEMATQESIDAFFEYRNYYKDKKIVVCGCLVSRYRDDLKKSMKEADTFVSCNDEENIVNVIKSLDINASNNAAEEKGSSSVGFEYVKISDGCNRKCSYCTIPYIRGKYKSATYDEIKADVVSAVDAGTKEIVLVAQDCGVWGHDLGDSLTGLLDKLTKDFADTNFRLLYVYPETISDDLIQCIASHKNIIKYIDMPIQHCNESILTSMGRKTNTDKIKGLVKKLRKEIPDVVLRTTVMCGYPGETEDAHDELCEFLQDVAFDYVGCFEYSAEEGTRAAKMEGQVESSVKYSWANEVRETCDAISLSKLEEKVGSVFDVLIEGEEDGQPYGRAYFQAPEVDGYVFIGQHGQSKKVKPGDLLRVKIVESQGYDYIGVIQDE